MKLREFIAGVAGAAAWPLAARAQQSKVPVIGVLNATSSVGYARELAAFRQGLNESGYVEGRNVAIEFRSADGQYEQLLALAADLVRRQVSVIATGGGIPSAPAAKTATTAIPIVFSAGVDPVELGLVASLSRPGGNITGVTNLNVEVGPKKLQLLHELIPRATTIGLLVNPTNPNNEIVLKDIQAAARSLGVEVDVVRASSEREIDDVFESLIQSRAGALTIGPDALFKSRMEQLVALTVRHAMPTIYNRDFAAAGGLIGYGASLTDSPRLAGIYTGRILKGREACGPSGGSVHQNRTRHQSQDRQSPRPHHPGNAVGHRRRGYSVIRRRRDSIARIVTGATWPQIANAQRLLEDLRSRSAALETRWRSTVRKLSSR
jgi:putative ABC transport system substrate-binding protein